MLVEQTAVNYPFIHLSQNISDETAKLTELLNSIMKIYLILTIACMGQNGQHLKNSSLHEST